MKIFKYQYCNNLFLDYNYVGNNKYNKDDSEFYGSVSPVLHDVDSIENLVFAEIGVFRGDSTRSIFEYCNVEKGYLIDPFSKDIAAGCNDKDFSNKFLDEELKLATKHRMAMFEDKCEWIEKMSCDAHFDIPDDTLDFLFIDGAHDYASVMSDLVLYYDKVKVGGVISGDDFSNRYKHSQGFGVVEALNDFCKIRNIKEVNVYRHPHKEVEYYSAFSFVKKD